MSISSKWIKCQFVTFCIAPFIYTDIRNQAITESAEFTNQSGATKLALVDKIKLEISVIKQGVGHLINVTDDVAAENELLGKRINITRTFHVNQRLQMLVQQSYDDKQDKVSR
jgi:hypothetical protein